MPTATQTRTDSRHTAADPLPSGRIRYDIRGNRVSPEVSVDAGESHRESTRKRVPSVTDSPVYGFNVAGSGLCVGSNVAVLEALATLMESDGVEYSLTEYTSGQETASDVFTRETERLARESA